jgi:hypothetical protein
MLTRLSHEALKDPSSLEKLEKEVTARIRSACPEVTWSHSWVVLGPCDYLDVFTAPSIETAMKVATIVRTFGHAQTEIWAATEWERFKEIARALPRGLVA